MGANINQIEGATEIERYFRNYVYATALSDMNNLQQAYLTDIDRCGYKGWSETPRAGSMHKFMEDASGKTNIPAKCVLFADANGRATFDPAIGGGGLTYDGYDLLIAGSRAVVEGDDTIVGSNGWEIRFTATGIDVYKDNAYSGISLA